MALHFNGRTGKALACLGDRHRRLSQKKAMFRLLAGGMPALLLGTTYAVSHADDDNDLSYKDSTGVVQTVLATGALDRSNPFFLSLGANGRACVTCHQPANAWSITPEHVQARFEASRGKDPLFRTVDGANSPNADVSTVEARRAAYSMLLTKGLIRVGLPIQPTFEFELAGVDDPYGYASSTELSLFRRPLPSTNLRFLTGVMWDGRENIGKFVVGNPAVASQTLLDSLAHQVIDATNGHAQAVSPPTAQQVQQIVAFEMNLTTTQSKDNAAGRLDKHGALGGPQKLSQLNFYVGVNDTLGADPTGAAFNNEAMTLFSDWSDDKAQDEGSRAARAAIARGEALFNTKPIAITSVGGLNDALGVPVVHGFCTTCHSTPNVGNHSVTFPINIGLTDTSRRTPDMPLYTLRNKVTNELIQTTDPGKAMISGKWQDIGKFKGPVLRGLAARRPYFHNGSAATLEDVVDFYDTRFQIGMTRRERADLAAFLNSL